MKKLLSILLLFSFIGIKGQSGITQLNNWSNTGNTFQTNLNWLGTRNAKDLVFKTNSVDRFTISSSGAISALGNIAITNTVTNTPVLSITSGTNLAFLLHDGTSFALGTDNAIPTEIYYDNQLKFKLNNNQFRFSDGVNCFFGTTTGSKIGETISQKLAFYGSTPIIQPTATTDLGTVLSNLGLRASGSAFPITTTGATSFSNTSFSGTVGVTNSITSGNFIGSTSKTTGIGYAVGSGSTVTQATSRTTGVTINAVTGAITLVSAAGSAAYQSFTVTNSAVAATDVVVVSQKSGTDLNEVFITAVAAGSFRISFATTGGTTTEQPVFNFAVIKGRTN